MKITIIQSKVRKAKKQNISHIKELLDCELETDLIVLPEMFLSPFEDEYFYQNSVTKDDEFFLAMSDIAKKHHAYLVAGSVPEQVGDKYYNTSFIFNDKGILIKKYRKIHLFEITYPNGLTYKESNKLSRGNELVTFHINQITIGVMICFDIRFPLLAKSLQEKGAEVLIVPAAFNQFTGPKHWELAFRSRAVDNQLFTVGVSPNSTSDGNYEYYGHSIIVDPMGNVLFEAGGSETVVHTIEIDINQVKNARKTLPILQNEVVVTQI